MSPLVGWLLIEYAGNEEYAGSDLVGFIQEAPGRHHLGEQLVSVGGPWWALTRKLVGGR